MSKNPLTLIMETNKFNGTNYTDWLRNLMVVLNFENQRYVLDKPLPTTLPEGSSPEERLTFEKWHEDNRKVRSIILASMTNEIQKQYDRLEDVPSIMLRVKEVYVVPDRHIRYAATKAFFGTKMAEGSSVQSHGVKMFFLVEKLENLKAGLNNDTYIDVILQSLPPSYNPFIVNYNMNGLEKSIHELINMLVQYEATTHKSKSTVLVGEASTSKAKGKGARRWKRKKGKGTAVTTAASTGGAPPASLKGKVKGKVGGSQRSKVNDACMHCEGNGHWKRECPQLLSNPGIFVVEINMVSNSTSWVLDTDCGAHICNNLQVLERSRKLNKDEMILRLDDGKAVAAKAVWSLSLVVSNHIRIDLKDCYFVPNVCGPLSIPAKGGFFYFITFTDDHSWYGYVYLMRYKSEAFEGLWDIQKTSGYYFYDLAEQKIFVSRNAVFLEKDFSSDSRRDEVLIEESNEEPHHDSTTSFEPTVHTDGVPVLHRSTKESRVPKRYGFVGLTSQLDNDPKTYE
ncbi:UNVERIFIED_CONTAM: hypothetical protein Slati_0200200 [Sesamum latifolium]|uniref:CCHC-type domain-containing protein n=1 Tax=Sesamum latifolium TaxID=2727402 RepID=A0AAW2YBN4_9LAMI